MKFTKMQGAGNDFIIVDALSQHLNGSANGDLGRRVCDRRFGIGADGLILVEKGDSAEFRMRMFNPDGSEAEMCGNGIRCFARFLWDRGYLSNESLPVETLAGVKVVSLGLAEGRVSSVRVDMGAPELRRSLIPMLGSPGEAPVVAEPLDVGADVLAVTCVSMGNPHCVTFVDSVQSYPVERMGPQIEHHPLFPKRANAPFVEIVSSDEIRVRVWERGAGETLACGTGACAAVVAGVLNKALSGTVTTHLRGGDLRISWQPGESVFMEGPAEEVFTGEYAV